LDDPQTAMQTQTVDKRVRYRAHAPGPHRRSQKGPGGLAPQREWKKIALPF